MCCPRACCSFTYVFDLTTADDVIFPPIQETTTANFQILKVLCGLLVIL